MERCADIIRVARQGGKGGTIVNKNGKKGEKMARLLQVGNYRRNDKRVRRMKRSLMKTMAQKYMVWDGNLGTARGLIHKLVL